MDIFLVPDDATANVLRKDSRFQKMHFIKVSDGPGALQGLRIHKAYVDRYCYEDPNYTACIETIHSSMGLTTDDGHIYLL
jgi:hypothetical protein